jgi:hypothetical protein
MALGINQELTTPITQPRESKVPAAHVMGTPWAPGPRYSSPVPGRPPGRCTDAPIRRALPEPQTQLNDQQRDATHCTRRRSAQPSSDSCCTTGHLRVHFRVLEVLRGLSDRRASRRNMRLTASMLLPFKSGRRSKISASSVLAALAL